MTFYTINRKMEIEDISLFFFKDDRNPGFRIPLILDFLTTFTNSSPNDRFFRNQSNPRSLIPKLGAKYAPGFMVPFSCRI